MLYVACVDQYLPPFLPFCDYVRRLLFVRPVQEVLLIVFGDEVTLIGLYIALIEEGRAGFYEFQVPDVGQSLIVLDLCDADEISDKQLIDFLLTAFPYVFQ